MSSEEKFSNENFRKFLKENNSSYAIYKAEPDTKKLGERYLKYNDLHSREFKQRKIEEAKREARIKNKKIYEQRLANCNQLAETLKTRYEKAIKTIKQGFGTCELFDMNLCIRSETDNTLEFLSPLHFDINLLNQKNESETDTNCDTYNKSSKTHHFESQDNYEAYEENGFELYDDYDELYTEDYPESDDDYGYYDDFYDDYEEKKERLAIKKSYKQYRVIKEYLILKKKIEKYESLLEPYETTQIFYDLPITNDIPHSNLLLFLYILTEGNIKTFYKLARFCATLKDNTSKNRAFAIYADPSIYNTLMTFLHLSTKINFKTITFRSIWKKQTLLNMQTANMNNDNNGLICFDEKLPDSESTVKTLRKLMKGNIITIKDDYYPTKLRIVNRMPIIYITKSRANFQKMKNIFSATTLELNSKNIAMPYLYPTDLNWLQNNFIALGTCNLKETEITSKPVKISNDKDIEDFIESVCIRGKDYECSIQELYLAYFDFYKHFYDDTPLTQIMFSKKFAAVTNLPKYRPHYKGQSNVYYFKGIMLDSTKLNSQQLNKSEIESELKTDTDEKSSQDINEFSTKILEQQFKLYLQQQENIRIFNYQKNLGL